MSVSRVIDNQHHYADILGGMFLGTMIALLYVLRAIPRYKRVLSPALEGEENDSHPGLLHTAAVQPAPAPYQAAAPLGKH